MQVPLTQLWLAWQAMPQPLQLFLSVSVLTSHPLPGFASQLAKPILHVPMPQALPAQPGVAFGRAGHTVPQAPQLAGSVVKSFSHPSGLRPLQLAKPGLHANEQPKATQTAVAFWAPGQTPAQEPQWCGSVW